VGKFNGRAGDKSNMTIDEYQAKAHATSGYISGNDGDVKTCALGLGGEAGAFLDKLKKIYRDKHGFISGDDRKALLLELGDVLWKCSELATLLECPLETIAAMNLAKLRDRQERGVLDGAGDYR